MVRLRRHPARADGPQHALGFFLIDAAISLAGHVTDRRTAISLVTLTFFVLAIGLTGLLGYLLAPDLLVDWTRSARMAVHTATGMLLASVGLWLSWFKSGWYREKTHFREAVITNPSVRWRTVEH